MVEICTICCDNYNATTNKCIKCQYCSFQACRKCVQTYLLQDEIREPKCMNNECGRPWIFEFLSEVMQKSFMAKQYKEHREKMLFQVETSFIPATQRVIEKEIMCEKIQEKIRAHENNIRILLSKLRVARSGREEVEEEVKQYIKSCPSNTCNGLLGSDWKCGICNVHVCKHCHEILENNSEKDKDRETENKKGDNKEKHECDKEKVETVKLLAKNTKPCPKCSTPIYKIDGCFAENTPILTWNGEIKMSQDIAIGDELVGDDGEKRIVQEVVSGLDDLYEVIQKRGIKYVVNSKHKLALKMYGVSDVVEITVDDYNKLAPSSKIDLMGFRNDGERTEITVTPIGKGKYYGWSIDQNKLFLLSDFTVVRNCDQMFCTRCHTAFSWNSMKIVPQQSRIHNPHYYEWLRNNTEGGEIRREPGDGDGCAEGGARLVGPNLLNSKIKRLIAVYKLDKDIVESIWQIYRFINHVQDYELNRTYPFTQLVDIQNNMELRKLYIKGLIDRESYQIDLQKKDKKRRKANEFHQVLLTFTEVATENLNKLYSQDNETIKTDTILDFIGTVHALKDHINESCAVIGARYNNVHPHILVCPKSGSWSLVKQK